VLNEQLHGQAAGRMPRRWTDLVEDGATWVLIVLALLTVTVAFVVGIGTFRDTAEHQRTEAQTRTLVTATVLETAPMLAIEQLAADVPARWIGPDGQPRTGIVTVVAGTFAGDEVSIWVDRNGARIPEPRPQLSAVTGGLLSGLAVLVAGGTLLAAVWLLVKRATAAANARRWGREWAAVGPRWAIRGPQ
jgi:hypothetical protein